MNKIKNYYINLRFNFLAYGVFLFIQFFNGDIYPQDSSERYGIKSSECNYINGQIFLRWGTYAENNIYSFQLFREDNLNGEFNRIDAVEGVNSIGDTTYIIVVDSLILPRTIYRYYALLNRQSENSGSVSDTIMIITYDINSVLLPQDIHTSGLDSLGAIKIQWKINSPQDILSIKIFRSDNYDSKYVELAEVQNTDSIFIDRTADPMKKYFYYLVMTDPFGNDSFRSSRVFGSYKSSLDPSPPYDLIGEGTKTGVKLQWTKPDDYILNYHIFRNDGIEESISLITTIRSDDSLLVFYDTSRTLKGDLFYAYAIQTENTSGILSLLSDTVYVKPDIAVSFHAPLELKGYELDAAVQLYWENLYESVHTLDGYLVYRKELQGELKPIVDSLISPKQNNFLDTTILAGKSYEYAVQAVDIHGNKSPLSSYILIHTEAVVLPPSGLKAQKSDNGVLIYWDEPLQPNINEYRIFRYERGKDPELISSVSAKEKQEYLDKTVTQGNLYFYFLKSVDTTSNESLSSMEIGIRP